MRANTARMMIGAMGTLIVSVYGIGIYSKLENRVELSNMEIVMSLAPILIGAGASYMLLKSEDS